MEKRENFWVGGLLGLIEGAVRMALVGCGCGKVGALSSNGRHVEARRIGDSRQMSASVGMSLL